VSAKWLFFLRELVRGVKLVVVDFVLEEVDEVHRERGFWYHIFIFGSDLRRGDLHGVPEVTRLVDCFFVE